MSATDCGPPAMDHGPAHCSWLTIAFRAGPFGHRILVMQKAACATSSARDRLVCVTVTMLRLMPPAVGAATGARAVGAAAAAARGDRRAHSHGAW
eukprot:CAMPEP_0115842870 /NCGR_PEP_ID=MMETSP0287-20121206/8020_1 /TAXON_ID=412157 /ORGANISM="Chrysochromulina rotalis, Strain UIO044" /LENGTH=94 /DNA_ID=CAMNT_0003296547 /DNA_START=117 /DNA_END=398 /DNA_ORIENTATION=-